jgi:hypothetical protein
VPWKTRLTFVGRVLSAISSIFWTASPSEVPGAVLKAIVTAVSWP